MQMIVDAAVRARQFDILVEVDRILSQSPYSALRDVRYGMADGRIVLEGRVPTWYMKQQAQSLVSGVAERHPIDNQITVGRNIVPAPVELRLVATRQQEAVPA
jgi:osmotically-inducible protein OsmY